MPQFWRRRPALAVLLALGAGLVVCERGFGLLKHQDDYTRYHNQVFEVARVVDGDTVDIDVADRQDPITRVRLWGVDAPEAAGSSEGGMHFGAEASDFARRSLRGQSVRVVLAPHKSRGKYGRLLGYIILESSGEMFNEVLLREGYAYADWRFDHPYKRQFRALEQRARRRGAGLWAEAGLDQMPAWRQRMERGQE